MALIQSPLLSNFDWIEHRFGTRDNPTPQVQDQMASLTQIHSARCLVASSPGCAGEGDALITREPALAVSIRTADCLPILLLDPEHRVIAAVHAGWRGTSAEIVRRTVDTMRAAFDTSPGFVIAAIGPGIGPCCYYVGDEVARKFGLDRAGYIDLAEANRQQLAAEGVPPSHIDSLALCTHCDPARFHSYRRDKDQAGRMISYIRIIPA